MIIVCLKIEGTKEGEKTNYKSGVSPLINTSNNIILFSNLDQTNTLNSYFSSIQQNDNGNVSKFNNLTK